LSKNDDDVVVNDQQLTVQHNTMTYKKLSLETNKAFSDYLNLKFNKNEEATNLNEENEFEKVVNLGLIQAKIILYSNNSILLHKGKKPRRDVWENLGRIAKEFLNYPTYPKISSCDFAHLLNKALGNKDQRTIYDYRETILLYCNFNKEIIDRCSDSRLGDIDVGFFVSLIPKQYLTTSSTSSFTLEDNSIGHDKTKINSV